MEEKYNETDYILFIGQECKFQSRSILIPIKDFIAVRKEEFETLKNNSKEEVLLIGKEEVKLKGTLKQKILWENNTGHQKREIYTEICNMLTNYAFGMDDDCYYDLKDKTWYDKSYINLCKGFNHVNNYILCSSMKKYNGNEINIVESFLFIEI